MKQYLFKASIDKTLYIDKITIIIIIISLAIGWGFVGYIADLKFNLMNYAWLVILSGINYILLSLGIAWVIKTMYLSILSFLKE